MQKDKSQGAQNTIDIVYTVSTENRLPDHCMDQELGSINMLYLRWA